MNFFAEIEARLEIFYIDFTESKNDKDKYDITKIPNIDKEKAQKNYQENWEMSSIIFE